MGKKDDNFIILLDIDRVFSVDELSVVQMLEETSATGAETSVQAKKQAAKTVQSHAANAPEEAVIAAAASAGSALFNASRQESTHRSSLR